MALVVRCWNLYGGRTFPVTGELCLERMVRLIAVDGPAVVCLQEVPLWALSELGRWSGREVRAAVTKRAWLGPLARWFQERDPDRIRSRLTGQANAVLVDPAIEIVSVAAHHLNAGEPLERRVCQLLELRAGDGRLLLANLHLSVAQDAARRELARVERLVFGEVPCIVAGDLNLPRTGLPGFGAPGPGIDQILVRGVEPLRGPHGPGRRSAGAREGCCSPTTHPSRR